MEKPKEYFLTHMTCIRLFPTTCTSNDNHSRITVLCFERDCIYVRKSAHLSEICLLCGWCALGEGARDKWTGSAMYNKWKWRLSGDRCVEWWWWRRRWVFLAFRPTTCRLCHTKPQTWPLIASPHQYLQIPGFRFRAHVVNALIFIRFLQASSSAMWETAHGDDVLFNSRIMASLIQEGSLLSVGPGCCCCCLPPKR